MPCQLFEKFRSSNTYSNDAYRAVRLTGSDKRGRHAHSQKNPQSD